MAAGQRVARRTVFYVEGYDPRGPSHYHALYCDEAAKQSQVNGLALAVGPRRKVSAIASAWTVSSADTQTDYVFLRYDDLMRKRWSRTTTAVVKEIADYTRVFWRQGVFAAMYRWSWPILIFAIMAPALIAIAAVLGALAGMAAGFFVPWSAALLIAAFAFIGLLALRPVLEPHLEAFWIGRIAAFAAAYGNGRTPEMMDRLDAFARLIADEAAKGQADEILLVGHSVGCPLAVAACARALELTGDRPAALSLLTLGQSIPMFSVQPGAAALRADLVKLAADPRVTWVDVSAARDGLCFVLTDPLAASGLAQPDSIHPKPKLVSARYNKLLTPATYARLRRDFYRLHFQYLMATEIAGDYDYFLITAGGMTLSDRFAGSGSVANYGRFRKKSA